MSHSHDNDDGPCPGCGGKHDKATEMYDRIDDMMVKFLEQTFDKSAFPENPQNLLMVAKILTHRAAHIAIEAGMDLPSFMANSANEMLAAQRCVLIDKLEERMDMTQAVMETQGKKPEDLN